jgi:hypothetical protein
LSANCCTDIDNAFTGLGEVGVLADGEEGDAGAPPPEDELLRSQPANAVAAVAKKMPIAHPIRLCVMSSLR